MMILHDGMMILHDFYMKSWNLTFKIRLTHTVYPGFVERENLFKIAPVLTQIWNNIRVNSSSFLVELVMLPFLLSILLALLLPSSFLGSSTLPAFQCFLTLRTH